MTPSKNPDAIAGILRSREDVVAIMADAPKSKTHIFAEMSAAAQLITEAISRENNDAYLSDIIGRAAVEPNELVKGLLELKEAGDLEMQDETLTSLQAFVESPEFRALNDPGDQLTKLFFFASPNGRPEERFRVKLASHIFEPRG